MSVYEIDCSTGEGGERPLTPEEQAALDAAQADAAAQTRAEMWATVDSVRGTELGQTDYCVEPFPVDMPQDRQAAFKAAEADWYAFRQALRDITPDQNVDPTGMAWPTLPSSPSPIVIASPPVFADSSAWPDYVPSA